MYTSIKRSDNNLPVSVIFESGTWVPGSQRHSAGNIDYDNVEVSREEDGKVVAVVHPEGSKPFRARSKTISDGVRK